MDRLENANQLFSWAEQQKLNSLQLQQASEQVPLQPAIDDWLAHANRVLLFGSVLLLSSAVIFFFAYNWPLMHYFSKLSLAAAAVLVSGTVAIFCPAYSQWQRAALLGCSLFTGALLALIGQTYQTGADVWQLFASWAALITPLVFLSKSRASYLLWLCLLELALLLYVDSNQMFWLFERADPLLQIALANLLLHLFCLFALPKMLASNTKPLRWLSAVALLIPLTFGAIVGAWDNNYQANLLYYVFIAAALALWYFRIQRDLFIFALLLFSAIALATSALARLLATDDFFFIANLLAIFVIGSSAGAAVWLKKLMQEPNHGA